MRIITFIPGLCAVAIGALASPVSENQVIPAHGSETNISATATAFAHRDHPQVIRVPDPDPSAPNHLSKRGSNSNGGIPPGSPPADPQALPKPVTKLEKIVHVIDGKEKFAQVTKPGIRSEFAQPISDKAEELVQRANALNTQHRLYQEALDPETDGDHSTELREAAEGHMSELSDRRDQIVQAAKVTSKETPEIGNLEKLPFEINPTAIAPLKINYKMVGELGEI